MLLETYVPYFTIPNVRQELYQQIKAIFIYVTSIAQKYLVHTQHNY